MSDRLLASEKHSEVVSKSRADKVSAVRKNLAKKHKKVEEVVKH